MDDIDVFHRLAGGFDQPMVVVTTAAQKERAGCLVGFSTQCSIDPPRFLVLLSDKNRTFRVALGSEALAVHLLGADDLPLAKLFGEQTGDEVDKFARCPVTAGPLGMPIIDGIAGWFVGRVLERQRLGDHVAHLLEPVAAQGRAPVPPLTLRDVRHLDPGHEA
jgi:flavin reductase (DIM6/NTAB) family NADH-FMN oxidoreductase RutF